MTRRFYSGLLTLTIILGKDRAAAGRFVSTLADGAQSRSRLEDSAAGLGWDVDARDMILKWRLRQNGYFGAPGGGRRNLVHI